MSSAAITARNRANATHSTGPRTAEGKARSAKNALKLGLSLQRHVILEHENLADFEALHADLIRIYAPQSEREELEVQEIAHCQWAFRRFDEAECFSLDTPLAAEVAGEVVPAEFKLSFLATLPTLEGEAQPHWKTLHNLCRYRSHWERRHQRAISNFDRARAAAHREARELRAAERQHFAQQRQQMARERHEWARQRYTGASAAPSSSAQPCAADNQPRAAHSQQHTSGFVPFSRPAQHQQSGPSASSPHVVPLKYSSSVRQNGQRG